MTFDPLAAQEKFQTFLILMDDQLAWLEDQAAANGIEIKLPGDEATLDKIESVFDALSLNKPRDEVLGLVVLFARYLGEWVIAQFGGAWTLPIDDPKSVNFNTPVVVGHTKTPGLQFAPVLVIRAYALRRKPGTLRTAVAAQIHATALDLSDLREDL